MFNTSMFIYCKNVWLCPGGLNVLQISRVSSLCAPADTYRGNYHVSCMDSAVHCPHAVSLTAGFKSFMRKNAVITATPQDRASGFSATQPTCTL